MAVLCLANVQTYRITFASGGDGTLSGATGQTVAYGSSTTPVTATASSGYHFVNWTGDSDFVTTTANPLTITNVTAALNITVNFAKNLYQFIGFKSPRSGTTARIGSTVQVVFQLKDSAGNYVSNALATLTLQKYSGGIPLGSPVVATSATNAGNVFKYDPKKKQYIYYLATRPLTSGTWQLRVSLDDGTPQVINIAVK